MTPVLYTVGLKPHFGARILLFWPLWQLRVVSSSFYGQKEKIYNIALMNFRFMKIFLARNRIQIVSVKESVAL